MFERAARELAAATLERERGIRRYEYLRLSDLGAYQATLVFDDYDAFIEHQSSEHHVMIAGAMGDMIATIRLERVDTVPGCSPLDATPPGDDAVEPVLLGQADESVLAARRKRYRAHYPLQPAAWWGATR